MTNREFTVQALAQRNAVATLEGLGQPLTRRVLSGAIRDAGDLTWYESPGDYEEALTSFIAERQRHGAMRLPSRRPVRD